MIFFVKRLVVVGQAFVTKDTSQLFVRSGTDIRIILKAINSLRLSYLLQVAYNVICLLMMYVVPLLIIIVSYGSIYYEIFQKSRMKNSGEI